MLAYIGVKAGPGRFEQVAGKIRNLSVKPDGRVARCDIVLGTMDIVVKVEGHDLERVFDDFISPLVRTEGVERTTTFPCVHSSEPKGLKVGAYIFVTMGGRHDPLENLRRLKEQSKIDSVSIVTGEYGLVCEAAVEHIYEIPAIVRWIQSLPGVAATSTFALLKESSEWK